MISLPRHNRPPAKRIPQHARGKARPQGAHKKARSEGLAKAVRDLNTQGWYAGEGEAAA